MVEFWDFRDEANASAALQLKELLHDSKNFAAAFEMVKVILVRNVAVARDWEAADTKYGGMRSYVEQRMAFGNKKAARLVAEAGKVTQDWSASLAKAEKLSLEAQYFSGLAEEEKQFGKCVSALKTSPRRKVRKGGKLLAPRSKGKKVEAEAKLEQVRVFPNAQQVWVVEFEARGEKLDTRLDQSALQGRVTDSNYLLLHEKCRRRNRDSLRASFTIER